MMMLRANGMRHPQVKNWSPETALKTNTATFARKQPGRRAKLRPGGNKTPIGVGPRPFHRQQYRAAPFAADPDTLDEAQNNHDDGAPDAYLLIARHQGHGKGRHARQQEGSNQRRLAPEPIAVMAEDERPDRPRDKPDEKNRICLHRADQRVRRRKVELCEDQPGHDAVKEGGNRTTR